jgi:hypothetical protein
LLIPHPFQHGVFYGIEDHDGAGAMTIFGVALLGVSKLLGLPAQSEDGVGSIARAAKG